MIPYYSTLLRLKLSPGIGDMAARNILQHYADHPDIMDYSARDFKSKNIPLEKKIVNDIINAQKIDLKDAINFELNLLDQNNINVISILDDTYPLMLKEIPDPPSILFISGDAPLVFPRNISIVGTRNHSEWGKTFTENIVADLKSYNVQIISGLASGIDTIAHVTAVDENIPTLAVLASGILNIYPQKNSKLAQNIVNSGGALISEHLPRTFPDKQNFPLRNRIVAGISKFTLIIESALKGGSMITAKLAAAYNREVGAVPGRPSDEKSAGCIDLIKSQLAHLITESKDVASILGWEIKDQSKKSTQLKMYLGLLPHEMSIIEYLKKNSSDSCHIDELMLNLHFTSTELSAHLLNLELQGYIQAISGKRYRLT